MINRESSQHSITCAVILAFSLTAISTSPAIAAPLPDVATTICKSDIEFGWMMLEGNGSQILPNIVFTDLSEFMRAYENPFTENMVYSTPLATYMGITNVDGQQTPWTVGIDLRMVIADAQMNGHGAEIQNAVQTGCSEWAAGFLYAILAHEMLHRGAACGTEADEDGGFSCDHLATFLGGLQQACSLASSIAACLSDVPPNPPPDFSCEDIAEAFPGLTTAGPDSPIDPMKGGAMIDGLCAAHDARADELNNPWSGFPQFAANCAEGTWLPPSESCPSIPAPPTGWEPGTAADYPAPPCDACGE